MAREVRRSEGQTPDAVVGAISLMRGQLSHDLSVADLADHVGYSRFHFSRIFAQATGLAPMEYLAALRFAQAKLLLMVTDEPVIDVCAEVGFSSLSTFTRRFQAAVGTAPAALRSLATDIAEHPVTPFAVMDPRQPSVTVYLHRTADNPHEELRMPRHTWIGWYPRPVPIGLPAAGILVSGDGPVTLPVCSGNPWLLAVSMRADADPIDQLAPSAPFVAAHRRPVTPSNAPREIHLRFAVADPLNVPLLSALASLRGR